MEITIRNLQKKIPINPKKVKSAVLDVLSLEHIKKPGEITICFVDDEKIRELNLKFLGHNAPTDVIAFDIAEPLDSQNIFADIVISTDIAIRNARIYNTSIIYELYLYVVHGILHILGYKDNNKKNRSVMRQKEKYLCSQVLSLPPKS